MSDSAALVVLRYTFLVMGIALYFIMSMVRERQRKQGTEEEYEILKMVIGFCIGSGFVLYVMGY
jgi:heme/copper-type cytochrome/quinol oxidase subunit 2